MAKKKANCCFCGGIVRDTEADNMMHVCSVRCGCAYLGAMFHQIRTGTQNAVDRKSEVKFKWTEEKIERMMALREKELSLREIAVELGTTKDVIGSKIYYMKKCSAKAATNAEQNEDV